MARRNAAMTVPGRSATYSRGAGTQSAMPAYTSRSEAGRGESVMYPVVYWAGVTTLLLWSAFSAYSAIMGL
jgi:hypothetical protein